MEITGIDRKHLPSIIHLCEREGWESYCEDPERTWRALIAPGVITMAAVEDDKTLGFAYLVTDGEIQSFLVLIVVAQSHRGRGIGKRLVEEVFAKSGAKRIDLLSTEGADDFYRSFGYRCYPGFRIYPQFTTGLSRD